MSEASFELHNAWEHELRDAKGLWLSSGHLVSFKFTDKAGKVKTAHGHFETQGKPGFAKIKADAQDGVDAGTYEVDHKYVEAMKAELPASTQETLTKRTTSMTKTKSYARSLRQGDVVKQGNGTGLFGEIQKVGHNGAGKTHLSVRWSDGKEFDMELPDTKEFQVWRGKPAKTITPKVIKKSKPTVEPLKESMTGAEIHAKKMETVKANLEKEGRFPIPRQTTSDHWGVDSDITKGAKQDYKKVYNKLASEDPKWKEKYPDYDSFFGRVKELSVDQQTQSPNELKDIPQEMKDINKAYATEVLGLKSDGKITFYRNAVNGHTNMEDSARGYVTTNADFAHDYNSDKGNAGSNGRYEIDAKPDEVYGMLGYSKLEDEYGVTVGHGVTKQPGRIRRVGDLKKPEVAPWLEEYDKKVSRSTGATPFRHHALAGLYDFHPVDEEVTDMDKMFKKWHFTPEDVKSKFDEKFGEGSYDDYKASGNRVGSGDLKKFFKPLGNGKVGFDPTRFEDWEDRSIAVSGYGETQNPETFKNDKYDNVLKMMSTIQDLTGQKIMTPRTAESKEPAKQTGVFNEHNPAQRMAEETSNAAENTRLSDLGYDPEKQITVFRGVPRGVKEIKPGDWVTDNEMLAQDYAGDGDVISMKVKHKHLLTDPSVGKGAYTEEMVYKPVADEAHPEDKFEEIEEENNPVSTDFNDNDMTEEEHNALLDYTDDGYDAISDHLRKGMPLSQDSKENMEQILGLLNKTKTTKDSTVYRGMSTTNVDRIKAMMNLKVGDVIHDKGISSTSDDSTRAEFFANLFRDERKKEVGRLMLKINLPKGSHAFKVEADHASYGNMEKETLLKPGIPMKVKRMDKKGDVHWIELDAMLDNKE